MDDVQADLLAYYEEEARQRLRRPPRGRRLALLDEFLSLLEREGRRSVVDFGAGPGTDGRAFVDAGHTYVGLDLAHGNGVLATEKGVTVIQASIGAPPLRQGSFDAGWSMSTLMHIPEPQVPAVLAKMVQPLRPGAPLLVAQWGAPDDSPTVVNSDEQNPVGRTRMFSLRTFDRNRALLSAVGSIEREDLWAGDDDWVYHVFLLRVPGRMAT